MASDKSIIDRKTTTSGYNLTIKRKGQNYSLICQVLWTEESRGLANFENKVCITRPDVPLLYLRLLTKPKLLPLCCLGRQTGQGIPDC